eukprot:7041161-Prymnesium_polylepis.2
MSSFAPPWVRSSPAPSCRRKRSAAIWLVGAYAGVLIAMRRRPSIHRRGHEELEDPAAGAAQAAAQAAATGGGAGGGAGGVWARPSRRGLPKGVDYGRRGNL